MVSSAAVFFPSVVLAGACFCSGTGPGGALDWEVLVAFDGCTEGGGREPPIRGTTVDPTAVCTEVEAAEGVLSAGLP